ncbi:Utp14-domain-containing protein [Marasmius fiardii PR-910]|nr:Utp14-domain-containing protein [Marasmius fiardii PR-910]
MARKSSVSTHKTRRPKSNVSKKQFNAAGYAKRQSRKAAKAAIRTEDDIYEYAPEKARRSKIALDLDRDEEAGFGNGDDEDMEGSRMKPRLLEEGDKVDTDDDEEIDSDAAFEESDEERFAGFFSSKKKPKSSKKKNQVRFVEVDLNEDEDMVEQGDGSEPSEEEEEESGEDDEFIDVLDILDGRGEPMNDDDDIAANPTNSSSSNSATHEDDGNDDGSDAEEDEDDEDEDENISISLSDAEEDATGALEELQDFVSSLDPSSTKKRRADDEEPSAQSDSASKPKKRRLLKEQTEAGEENEYRTKGAGLTLTDLLAPLSGNATAAFEKSVKVLQQTGSVNKKKPQTLSAPLPQRAQERLDREAAYEQTKEEVQKWSATMKRIQEADHLSFPLQPKETQGKVSNLELAAKFKPRTTLESTISNLLTSANLATDASVLQTEENLLKANELSVEEVAERRKELRRMRELMFRAEVKAKRVKKIKSKVYRRIKRKEREKGDNAHDVDEDEEEARLRHETERARERATLKHKNAGKWAKSIMRRGGHDEDEGDKDGVRTGRQEIEDMLARGERLRRKIAGKDTDESESGSDEDEDDGIPGAFDELKALRAETLDQAEDGQEKSKGGTIFDMKFMREAEARRQQEANAMVDDFMQEMAEDVGEEGVSGNAAEASGGGVLVSRTGGRMVYRPGATATSTTINRIIEKAPSEGSSTLKSTADLSSTPPSPIVSAISNSRPLLSQPDAGPSTDTSNPWLIPAAEARGGKAPRKKNEIIVAKDSSTMTKSKNKLKKQAKKTESDKAKAKEDAVVEIQLDSVFSATAKGKAKEVASAAENDEDSDVNSEGDVQEAALLKKGKKVKGPAVFEQRELVARAFAGDNVVKDFEDAKRREIAMDAPKEVDTTLPGWGSWGGIGTKKAPAKSHLIKKVAGIDPKTRADYGKSHVIISEKRDKKAAKYLVSDLPYPYTSKVQYERRMEQPLGPEWNTRVGFQRGTLPKVVKKMGTVIEPLEKLF